MKKFRLTMMCSACKWKIEAELKNKGFTQFDIDMESSVLTFKEDVLSEFVISIVNRVGYQIEEIDPIDNLSDEELAIIEDSIRNGYQF